MFDQKEFDKAIKAIKFERQYQDKFWSANFDDAEWHPSDWADFIEKYIDKLR